MICHQSISQIMNLKIVQGLCKNGSLSLYLPPVPLLPSYLPIKMERYALKKEV